MSEEDTNIELPEKSAALVIHEDMKGEMHLPESSDEETVPPHVLFIAAVGVVWNKYPEQAIAIVDSIFRKYEDDAEPSTH